MKYLYYTLIIAALISVFILGKSCNKPEILTPFNTNDLRKKEAQIKALKPIIEYREKEVTKWRTKWRNLPQDTIPCDSAIVIQRAVCDTLILKDSLLIQIQADVISKQDSVIMGWHEAHSNDSTLIVSLRKEVKRQKRQKWLIGIGGLIGVGLMAR